VSGDGFAGIITDVIDREANPITTFKYITLITSVTEDTDQTGMVL
jgi:hypothetical protein